MTRVFLILLSLLLTAPFWLPLVESREQAYQAVPNRFANFHYVADQVFRPEKPLSVVFLGSSSMWTAFDPIVLEKSLSAARGEPTPVGVFAHNWRSEETIYYMLLDLLSSDQPPDLVIASYPEGGGNIPHPAAGYLFSPWLHGDVWLSLPIMDALGVYLTSVASAPRRLVNILLSIPEVIRGRNARVRRDQGAILSPLGFIAGDEPREDYRPEWFDNQRYGLNNSWLMPHRDVSLRDNIELKILPLRSFEVPFIEATARLETKFAYVLLPSAEDPLEQVIYRTESNEINCVQYIGAPLSAIFPAADRQIVRDAYYNANHFNAAGAAYLSRIYHQVILELLDGAKPTCSSSQE